MPKKISDLTINNTPSSSDVIPYSNGVDATDRGLNVSYFDDKIQAVDDKIQAVDDKASLFAVTVAASDASPSLKSGADFVCDGTDDDIEIINAINSLPENTGGDLVFRGGVFSVSSTIPLRSNINLIIPSGTSIRPVSGLSVIFEAIGEKVGAKVSLTQDTMFFDNKINVEDASSFSTGDFVLLGSEQGIGVGKIGEYKTVQRTENNTVFFEGSIYDEYKTSDSAFIQKITPIENINVKGGEFEGVIDGDIENLDSYKNGRAFSFQFCKNVFFEKSKFKNFKDRGIFARSVVRGDVDRCEFRRIGPFYSGSGYGVHTIDGCQNWNITKCKSYRSRKLWDAGAFSDGYGIVRFVEVSGCHTEGCVQPVATHQEAEYITITNNNFDSTSIGGSLRMNFRGNHHYISHNTFIGNDCGIRIQDSSYKPSVFSIESNIFDSSSVESGTNASIELVTSTDRKGIEYGAIYNNKMDSGVGGTVRINGEGFIEYLLIAANKIKNSQSSSALLLSSGNNIEYNNFILLDNKIDVMGAGCVVIGSGNIINNFKVNRNTLKTDNRWFNISGDISYGDIESNIFKTTNTSGNSPILGISRTNGENRIIYSDKSELLLDGRRIVFTEKTGLVYQDPTKKVYSWFDLSMSENQIRLRFKNTGTLHPTLKVEFIAAHPSSGETPVSQIEKMMSFRVSEGLISQENSNIYFNVGIDDSNCFVEHTGDGFEYDLIIQQPKDQTQLAHLTVSVLNNRSGEIELIDFSIEEITT